MAQKGRHRSHATPKGSSRPRTSMQHQRAYLGWEESLTTLKVFFLALAGIKCKALCHPLRPWWQRAQRRMLPPEKRTRSRVILEPQQWWLQKGPPGKRLLLFQKHGGRGHHNCGRDYHPKHVMVANCDRGAKNWTCKDYDGDGCDSCEHRQGRDQNHKRNNRGKDNVKYETTITARWCWDHDDGNRSTGQDQQLTSGKIVTGWSQNG